MITVKQLRELLSQIPDEARVHAYEGEDIGLGIRLNDKSWWIRARDSKEVDDYTEGFDE